MVFDTLSFSSVQAKANISVVLDTAVNGEPVEITRRDGSAAVVISKAEFEVYQNAKLDAEFDAMMQRHGHTVAALTDR
ncbi:type II toxin-antitoxin system prevent-host-death family antitoxin [Photorhabdus noenieputensis]|uniref:type II toxin-antitoxin system Phd/YefM family antitoxin n=1 Tax=Photorhabdus noenieputensis TaxID=1208607 RepID=UPI001BD2F2D0|nr:type II toxin-antitoxin system prevent-host-death family antitoxin [Photorhabdus noenieputensis]MBS9437134.1 type II toxin-antitoxin system prevent-host-death family antitoxin [Photorhabdus noenieputensis]MCK3670459.1 type II toxin-antitoxin system prevent-host-death family antitoxin [Photorhabdus noenieputensis]